MRIRVWLNGAEVKGILARRNIRTEWLVGQLSVSSWYIFAIINEQKSVSPEMRTKIQKCFKGYSWDRLFKIEEVD